jgi:hypothetical protein
MDTNIQTIRGGKYTKKKKQTMKRTNEWCYIIVCRIDNTNIWIDVKKDEKEKTKWEWRMEVGSNNRSIDRWHTNGGGKGERRESQ